MQTADHAGEVGADEGDVLAREAGAVLALDVAQDRRLVGDLVVLQRADRVQDHQLVRAEQSSE